MVETLFHKHHSESMQTRPEMQINAKLPDLESRTHQLESLQNLKSMPRKLEKVGRFWLQVSKSLNLKVHKEYDDNKGKVGFHKI